MTDITQSVPGLNQGQQECADAFFAFLLDDTQKEFGIKGGGGVGKSHLVTHLIDVVMPRYHEMCQLMNIEAIYEAVDMTSLTNKASEVLAQFTGRPVSTIHSFMNLKVVDDYETGRSKISKIEKLWKVHENIVLFIDECSMIDSQLDKIIQEGTHNTKIVYVGDHCQMAPVMEKISPIYRHGRMQSYELTQQMRTQTPEIQALHKQLRETVETGIFKPIQIVPGIIDHLDDNQAQVVLAELYSQQTTEHRILSYTNKRTMAYNDWIRHLRGLPAEYTVGELLVNNSAIRLSNGSGRTMLSVEEEVEITEMGDPFPVPVGTYDDPVDLIVVEVNLKTRSGGRFEGVRLPVDRKHFLELQKYYARSKNWERHYNLKNNYPDLRQRDAATVYKSQGSTYQTCYIDLGDISTCTKADQVARMLYVAMSRERQRIYLYGQLAPKYGGLIL